MGRRVDTELLRLRIRDKIRLLELERARAAREAGEPGSCDGRAETHRPDNPPEDPLER